MRICLAPMDGITDLAYRTICKEIHTQYGHHDDQLMLWTEFMSAEGYVHNPPWVIKHLRMSDYEPQLIAQIFWWTTDPLLQCATDVMNKYPFAWIEINMGCPSPSIMKCDAWSAMLKDKQKTLGILRDISLQLPHPLSLKTRTWLTKEDIEKQFDFLCEASQYVWMIIVHGRTYSQSHAGDVNWEFLYRLKKSLPDKIIIGNGGIRSYTNAEERLNTLDGIMIGQSAIGNPWVLTPHTPWIEERFAVIFRHLKMMMASERLFQHAQEQMKKHHNTIVMPTYAMICEMIDDDSWIGSWNWFRSPVEFRKYLFNYISWLPGNKQLKQDIPARKDYHSLMQWLNTFYEQLLQKHRDTVIE